MKKFLIVCYDALKSVRQNLVEILTRHNSARRLAFVCFIPIAMLGIDFALSPIFFDTSVKRDAADLAELFRSGSLALGNLRGHHIFVSIDDIRDQDFLVHLPKGKTALVLTAFPKDGTESDYIFGPLTQAVLSRLRPVSSADYLRLENIPEQIRGSAPGQVTDLALRIPLDQYANFPLNDLLIIAMPKTQATESLGRGLKHVFAMADEKSVDNIVIPNLGLKWQNSIGDNEISLSDYFKILLDGVQKIQNYNNIYISIYKSWPTLQVEGAASALDAAWQEISQDEIRSLPIHNRNSRLIEFFLIPCAISSGIMARLSIGRVTILAAFFITAGYVAIETVEKATPEFSETNRLAFIVVTLIIFSVFFPFLTKIDPKDIFSSRK